MTKIKENPLVDNAIELIRHKRDVQELIELMDEKGIVYGLSQMPKLQSSAKGAVALTQNNIPMTSSQTKVILQKRLPILLAHGGFTRKAIVVFSSSPAKKECMNNKNYCLFLNVVQMSTFSHFVF